MAALITVQFLFGGLPPAGKIIFLDMHPFAFMAIRSTGAALVLFLLLGLLGRRLDIKTHWKEVIILGTLGLALNQGLFVAGLARTTAINVAIIIASIPVFTYIVAVLLRQETFGPRRAIGIGIALSGIAYLVGITGYQTGNILGDLLIVANCLAYASYLAIGKKTMMKVDTLGLVAWMFVYTSLIFIPIALFFDLPGAIDATLGNTELSLWVLFAILGPSAAVYVLNATALKDVPSSTVAIFIYLQPIVTAILAHWLLDEALSPKLIPAAAAVFLGVWIVAVRRPKNTMIGMREGTAPLE